MKKVGILRIFITVLCVSMAKVAFGTEVFATSRVHFIGVGMSDAILIESNGHYGLVDASNPDRQHILDVNSNIRTGGAEAECGDQCENDNTNVTAVVKYLRSIGINHLDFVLTTHNHSDHVGGMPTIAEQGFVDGNTTYFYRDCRKNSEDLANKGDLASGAYYGWQNFQYCKNAENSMQSRGAKMYNFDNNARLDQFDFYGSKINLYNIYSPTGDVKHAQDKENRNSIVVKVTDEKGKKTLLTSDILEEEEKQLLGIGPVDVLKVSHHGVNESNSHAFLQAMNPKEAVMTNYENCYGRADCNFDALNFLKSKGVKLNITNDNGSVVVSSDSNGISANHINSGSDLPASNNTSGWIEKEGKWYYYSNGSPLKGWQELDWSKGRNWFYFDQDGVMLKGTRTPDGYYVDQDGVWDGQPASSKNNNSSSKVGGTFDKWAKVGDTWYYYDDKQNKVTGWQEINGTYYFFDEDGRLKTGWLVRDHKYYYYDENGNLLKNTVTPDGYIVDAHGVWNSGINHKDASNQGSPSSSSGKSSSKVGGTFTKNSSNNNKNSSQQGGSNNSNNTSGNLSNTNTANGTSSSGSNSNCVKLAIIKVNGKDCVDSPEEALFAVLGMVLNILTYGIGIAAGAGFIFSGYQYMTSKSEPAVVAKVKTRIMHIVIGLLVYFTFWGIVNLLLPGGVFSTGS